MKILITGGGSEEPIDNVRSVCNFSTGKTSAFLADFFAQNGEEVKEIVSERCVKPEKTRFITYRTFCDLKNALEKECRTGNYDAIIHAAAVSDYSPDTIEIDGKTYSAGSVPKISGAESLVIRMKKNPKLVDSLKIWSGENTKVVAFKLTSQASIEERKACVMKIFNAHKDKKLSPDYVVSNDKSEITAERHPCRIFDKTGTVTAEADNLKELAETLSKILKKS